MANTASNSGSVLKGIVNSWSLMSFAQAHGKPQVGSFEHVDEETGEVRKFKSMIFTEPESNARTFVSFSSNLGELTPAQISEQKKSLQVVELEGGHFSLCKQGANAWEDVLL